MKGRRGFTLIETIVALVIASLVIMVAHGLLVNVIEGARRARTAAANADRWATRRDWLVRVFGSLDTDALKEWGFRGTSGGGHGSIAFVTRGRTGVAGSARVQLRLGTGGWGLVARVESVEGPTRGLDLVLADSVTSFDADFLLEYGANARWVHTWMSPATAPLAARLRVGFASGAVDTLLLRIGARG